jgi:flavin reductase (DIM6/NTAB) family NADH-FMN oxidoreductase RutF
MSVSVETSFDERRFRDALAAFATGVAVVAGVTAAGRRLGVTVSSFNSVSLAPPLVLFSLARRANSFDAWCALERYSINVLSTDQEALSNRFARPLADKWSGVAAMPSPSGLPLLPNSLAAFECEAYARYEGGDHEIFVGRVFALHLPAQRNLAPLIFFGGRYRRLDPGFHDPLPWDASLFGGW